MPQLAALNSFRASIYLEDGLIENARQDLKKSGEMNPTAPGLFLGRGELDVLSGNNAMGVRDLTEAVKQTPSDPAAIIWLHNARYHIGNDDCADLQEMRLHLSDAHLPSAVVDLYAGKTTVDAVRAQAKLSDADVEKL